jgi:hypothetical protein
MLHFPTHADSIITVPIINLLTYNSGGVIHTECSIAFKGVLSDSLSRKEDIVVRIICAESPQNLLINFRKIFII